jgi:surfactin synthase thioesterase subunit
LLSFFVFAFCERENEKQNAGGGPFIYRTGPKSFPPEVEICAIHLPGREKRLLEPLLTRLEPLIAILADVLMPYFTTPFVFFGHSMGALISFELIKAAASIEPTSATAPVCVRPCSAAGA